MVRVLFQGDSITDASRSRTNDADRGRGYPTLVAARLGFEEPGKYIFLNRGIGGNRSIDLLARVKADIINLKPDVMSILIGVNDVWHELADQNGVDSAHSEVYYSLILEQVLAALPQVKIMLLEPFVLKGAATEKMWEAFRSQVEEKAAVTKRVAEKFGLPFVPLLREFDEAAARASADVWLADGVHPTAAGHELIARQWLKAFKAL